MRGVHQRLRDPIEIAPSSQENINPRKKGFKRTMRADDGVDPRVEHLANKVWEQHSGEDKNSNGGVSPEFA